MNKHTLGSCELQVPNVLFFGKSKKIAKERRQVKQNLVIYRGEILGQATIYGIAMPEAAPNTA